LLVVETTNYFFSILSNIYINKQVLLVTEYQ
jgi:hypothetical protein